MDALKTCGQRDRWRARCGRFTSFCFFLFISVFFSLSFSFLLSPPFCSLSLFISVFFSLSFSFLLSPPFCSFSFLLSPPFCSLSLFYRPPFRAQSSTALCRSSRAKLGIESSSETVALPPPSFRGTFARNSSTAAGESAAFPPWLASGPSSPARMPERGAPLTFRSLR